MQVSHPKFLLATLILILLSACARTERLSLRTVDARTAEPVRNISVLWAQESSYNLVTGKQKSRPEQRVNDADDGMLALTGVHRDWFNRFVIYRSGYSNTYGIYSSGEVEVGEHIEPPPLSQRRFILQKPFLVIYPSNGCFVIPMQRTPLP
jgi:hypothetical protein